MKIGAIIITYNPREDLFPIVVESLFLQVDSLIIIDNGSRNSSFIAELLNKQNKNVNIVFLEDNKGIAKATNIGIEKLIAEKCDFILTSDQDTIYRDDYIFIFKEIKKKNISSNVAAFCPVFFDEVANEYAPIILKKMLGIKKSFPLNDYTDVFHAIASGMIINTQALKQIGLMNEELFIDWVDLEWCWRANYYGKKIVCCKSLNISHHLGDESKNIGFRKVPLRSHIRHYYITRNSFYLALHSKYLNPVDKVLLFVKSFQYIFGYTILCKNHFTNFRYTIKGFCDALKNKMGKLQD